MSSRATLRPWRWGRRPGPTSSLVPRARPRARPGLRRARPRRVEDGQQVRYERPRGGACGVRGHQRSGARGARPDQDGPRAAGPRSGLRGTLLLLRHSRASGRRSASARGPRRPTRTVRSWRSPVEARGAAQTRGGPTADGRGRVRGAVLGALAPGGDRPLRAPRATRSRGRRSATSRAASTSWRERWSAASSSRRSSATRSASTVAASTVTTPRAGPSARARAGRS